MKFLITRPLEQSKRFSCQLVEAFGGNIKVCISPVIEINTLKKSINTTSFQGLIFTSENGVRAFAKLNTERNLPAFCVGNQTALVARSCGFLAVSAQGDTNQLILLLKEQASELRLLYLRGKHVSADIEQELRKDNIKVVSKIVYKQNPIKFTHQAVEFLSGPDKIIVPLFSDRSNVILSKQFF
jgi:uroporphyrinogen-III synthase